MFIIFSKASNFFAVTIEKSLKRIKWKGEKIVAKLELDEESRNKKSRSIGVDWIADYFYVYLERNYYLNFYSIYFLCYFLFLARILCYNVILML